MKIVIFAGPSLPLELARPILDAVYLPPAKQSDMLTVLRKEKPDVVGLIDGRRVSAHPVWHKEILFALRSGVQVYGAAALGALRAVELEPYGMVGVGKVFHIFRDGFVDDDEIVCAVSPDGMERRSDPMINIRATLEAGAAAGVVSRQECDGLIQKMKALFYPERSFVRLLEIAKDEAGDGTGPALADFVREHAVDVMRDDALDLLHVIGALPELDRPVAREILPPADMAMLQTQYDRERRVQREDGEIALHEIADYAALNCSEYDDLSFHALNRAIIQLFAEQIGLEPTPEEIASEKRRFRVRNDMEHDDAFAQWLRSNDLCPDEFDELMGQIARCRALHRWLMTTKRPLDRSTKLVLDEMRLAGSYPEWADKAAFQECLIQAAGIGVDRLTQLSQDVPQLMKLHMAATGLSIDTSIPEWAVGAGFLPHTLLLALLKSRAAREAVGKSDGPGG